MIDRPGSLVLEHVRVLYSPRSDYARVVVVIVHIFDDIRIMLVSTGS